MRLVKSFYFGGVVLAMATAVPASAQTTGPIYFQNTHSFKIKICQYDGSDKVTAVPRQCFSLNEGATWRFDTRLSRGKSYRFRVFEVRKIFDKELCTKRISKIPSDIMRYDIGAGCLMGFLRAAPAPPPPPPPSPPPALVAEHKVGDIVMVALRDNPNNRAQRYFPAEVTGVYNIADRYTEYRFKQLNGRRGRTRDENVKKDMVGVGTQIIAKQINGSSAEFGRVTERHGKLMKVEFNDGNEGYVDLANIKVDEEDFPVTAKPKEEQPAWVIRMCSNNASALSGAVGFKPNDGIEISYGWFKAKPNQCVDMPIGGAFEPPAGWHMNTRYVFAYAEKIVPGGVRRPVNDKPINAKSYCVSVKDTWSVSKQGSLGVVWAYCNKNGERLVPFQGFPLPKGGGIIDFKL